MKSQYNHLEDDPGVFALDYEVPEMHDLVHNVSVVKHESMVLSRKNKRKAREIEYNLTELVIVDENERMMSIEARMPVGIEAEIQEILDTSFSGICHTTSPDESKAIENYWFFDQERVASTDVMVVDNQKCIRVRTEADLLRALAGQHVVVRPPRVEGGFAITDRDSLKVFFTKSKKSKIIGREISQIYLRPVSGKTPETYNLTSLVSVPYDYIPLTDYQCLSDESIESLNGSIKFATDSIMMRTRLFWENPHWSGGETVQEMQLLNIPNRIDLKEKIKVKALMVIDDERCRATKFCTVASHTDHSYECYHKHHEHPYEKWTGIKITQEVPRKYRITNSNGNWQYRSYGRVNTG